MTAPILCTLFDRMYLAKGLALLASLERWHPFYQVFVLVLDEDTETAVRHRQDTHVTVVPFRMLDSRELRVALADRDPGEQCWTLTPQLLRVLLAGFALPHLTYVDADSFLFGPLTSVYREIGNADLAIVPHRFPPKLAWRAQSNGIYNVNFVYVRNSDAGLTAVDEWAEQCLRWCYRRSERMTDGTLRFGDQGYLDDWAETRGAHVMQHLGLNLAPWSQMQYRYCFEQRLYVIAEPEPPKVERIDPLVLYHFHGHTRTSHGYDRGGYALHPDVLQHIYTPYEFELAQFEPI